MLISFTFIQDCQCIFLLYNLDRLYAVYVGISSNQGLIWMKFGVWLRRDAGRGLLKKYFWVLQPLLLWTLDKNSNWGCKSRSRFCTQKLCCPVGFICYFLLLFLKACQQILSLKHRIAAACQAVSCIFYQKSRFNNGFLAGVQTCVNMTYKIVKICFYADI